MYYMHSIDIWIKLKAKKLNWNLKWSANANISINDNFDMSVNKAAYHYMHATTFNLSVSSILL